MKKIIGTILAAGLALSAFAAEPAANFVMADFTGDAEFGWEANFADSENVKMGMYNKATSKIKFGLITEGTKGTTGDGIWGDLQIKFADGLNWEAEKGKGDVLMPDLKAPSIEVAKIHLVDGDFSAALSILQPNLKYDPYTTFTATPVGLASKGIGNLADDTDGLRDDNEAMSAGFGLEFALKDIVAANVKLMDNGIEKTKKMGLAFDVSLLAVENLEAKVAGSFNFGNSYNGFQALAAYKFPLDMISDKLYVKAGAAFDMNHRQLTDAAKKISSKEFEDTKALAAGLMFGWGGEGLEPSLDFIANKTNEGLSFAVSTNMEDKGLQMGISLYDESLFSLLGLEDFGKLSTGVEFTMRQTAGLQNELKVASKYHGEFSPIYVDVHGGMDMKMYDAEVRVSDTDLTKKAKNVLSYKVGLRLGSKEIIDNTDVYAEYNLAEVINPEANTSKDEKILTKTNAVTIGTKIHF